MVAGSILRPVWDFDDLPVLTQALFRFPDLLQQC